MLHADSTDRRTITKSGMADGSSDQAGDESSNLAADLLLAMNGGQITAPGSRQKLENILYSAADRARDDGQQAHISRKPVKLVVKSKITKDKPAGLKPQATAAKSQGGGGSAPAVRNVKSGAAALKADLLKYLKSKCAESTATDYVKGLEHLLARIGESTSTIRTTSDLKALFKSDGARFQNEASGKRERSLINHLMSFTGMCWSANGTMVDMPGQKPQSQPRTAPSMKNKKHQHQPRAAPSDEQPLQQHPAQKTKAEKRGKGGGNGLSREAEMLTRHGEPPPTKKRGARDVEEEKPAGQTKGGDVRKKSGRSTEAVASASAAMPSPEIALPISEALFAFGLLCQMGADVKDTRERIRYLRYKRAQVMQEGTEQQKKLWQKYSKDWDTVIPSLANDRPAICLKPSHGEKSAECAAHIIQQLIASSPSGHRADTTPPNTEEELAAFLLHHRPALIDMAREKERVRWFEHHDVFGTICRLWSFSFPGLDFQDLLEGDQDHPAFSSPTVTTSAKPTKAAKRDRKRKKAPPSPPTPHHEPPPGQPSRAPTPTTSRVDLIAVLSDKAEREFIAYVKAHEGVDDVTARSHLPDIHVVLRSLMEWTNEGLHPQSRAQIRRVWRKHGQAFTDSPVGKLRLANDCQAWPLFVRFLEAKSEAKKPAAAASLALSPEAGHQQAHEGIDTVVDQHEVEEHSSEPPTKRLRVETSLSQTADTHGFPLPPPLTIPAAPQLNVHDSTMQHPPPSVLPLSPWGPALLSPSPAGAGHTSSVFSPWAANFTQETPLTPGGPPDPLSLSAAYGLMGLSYSPSFSM